MKEQLLNQQDLRRRLRQLSLVFVMLLLPLGLWAQVDYAIKVAGIDVTSENAGGVTGDGIQGSVTYDADQKALILDGATITGNIVATGGTALKIKLKGENVINAGTSSAIQAITEPNMIDLAFVKEGTGDCSLQLNSTGVTVISTYFSTPTYTNLALVVEGVDYPEYYGEYGLAYYAGNNTYEPITAATITSYTTYDLIVSGEQVTSLNKNAICKGQVGVGHITFDGEHTLTLNEVPAIVFDGSNVPGFIQTSMDLTINLVGNNSFDCGNSTFITKMAGDNDTHTVTFTTDANNPGMLTLQVGDQFDGFEKAFENGLEWKPEGYYDTTDPNAPKAWVAQPFALDGEGTAESPYLIKTANDLKTFSNYVNNGFITTEIVKLNNDIDCSAMTGFVPIGSKTPFIGTFDGNNKTISGLKYISENANDVVGLFARVGTEGGPTGTIENLVLENCSLGGGYINGGIVGIMNSGTLQLCKVTGNSTISAAVGDDNIAGAIVGQYSQAAALVGNYYYYTVTTLTIASDAEEAIVKSGHEERGIGDSDDITADDGAMLYTKQLTTTGLGDNCAYEGDPGYGPLADFESFIFHYAPGTDVTLYLYPNEGLVPSVNLSYTETGETEPTVVPLEKDPDEEGYVYSFTMPDVNATFAITLSKAYALYIGNTQVTSLNADDVLGDGSVSFAESGGQEAAPTYTLTLNGATLTQPVKIGLANLTIDIQGTNSITTEERCIQKMENTTPAITFKSTSDVVGSLTLNGADGVNSVGEYGEGSFTISDELALVLKKDGYFYSNPYWFTDGSTKEAILSPSYGVTVGEMQICADNADDVVGYGIGSGNDNGMVSFDKEKSILTLTNASLSGVIRSSLPDLTIELVGNNSIYSGGDRILQAGVAVNMTIQSSADAKGSLSMHKGYSSSEKGNFVDDNVTLKISNPLAVISGKLKDDNRSDDYYAVIGEAYDLAIETADAVYPVTALNCSNVLEEVDAEPSVKFDGHKRLVLNNAYLKGIINGIDDLEIYLQGNSTIANNSALIETVPVVSTGAPRRAPGDLKVTFTTSGNAPGELTYLHNPCSTKDDLTIADFLQGFDVEYGNKLFASLKKGTPADQSNPDDEGAPDEVVVKTPIGLIVDNVEATAQTTVTTIDYGQITPSSPDAPVATNALKNLIVNNVLYTLDDQQVPNVKDDGYYDGQLVINSTMEDAKVQELNEDVMKGLLKPGTAEYAHRFKGLTFMLPAGIGTVEIFATNEPGYEFHLLIHQQPQVVRNDGESPCRLTYALTSETYAYLYLVKTSSSAPAYDLAQDRHRIGPKSGISGKLKSVKASCKSAPADPDPAAPYKLLDADAFAAILAGASLSSGGHLLVDDIDITDLADNLFIAPAISDDPSPAPAMNAPRRAGSLKIPTDLTYVDFSKTQVLGLEISRTAGAFNGIPENVFIYVPAGNTVAAGTKNVIVGGIADVVELDGTGGKNAVPFEVSDQMADNKFIAAQVTLKRSFAKDVRSTVYLPFAIPQDEADKLGSFYKYDGLSDDGEDIKMTKVTDGGLKANMPYIFTTETDGGVADITVKCAEVELAAAGTLGFVGTYKHKDYEDGMYCLAATEEAGISKGQFVKMKEGSYVPPFRAYFVAGTDKPSYAILWSDDDTTTGLSEKVTANSDKIVDAEGWYTLDGRKLTQQPTEKGIYIHNGKKVVR